jgi:creatinine amidohydrolase
MTMTKFFRYELLTWPEVDSLPRDTPLLIPFGEDYPRDRLSNALGSPAQIGILPAVPFGWARSGLQVPDSVLEVLVRQLLNSLRDDGFTRVFALIPPGLHLGLGAETITLPTSLPSPRPPILPDNACGKVILIPIGHTEQHAYHLPMSTDTCIIDAISQGTAATVPELAASLPVMPYGVSTHRQAFAGTLNTGGRAFEDFWISVIDVLAARGFDRIYLISGHGGNCSFLTNVVKYAGERHPDIFSATTWLYLSGPEGSAALQKYRKSGLGGMGHAGELETALMLHLHPELVHMERVIDEIDFISTPSYYMDWVEGGALVANPPWEDDTTSGAYGAGSLATAENGRNWLEAAISEKVAHVAEIHQQIERRSARRSERLAIRHEMLDADQCRENIEHRSQAPTREMLVTD